MFKPTTEQVTQWKKQHGEDNIFMLDGGDKCAYVRKPDRKVISMASTMGEGDEIRIAELIIDAIWIDGDAEMKEKDEYFLAARNQLNKMIELKEVTLKKI